MSLVELPRDVLVQMLSTLDLESLGKICQSSSQLNQLCDDDILWVVKYQNEFNETFPPNYERFAKNLYLVKIRAQNYDQLNQIVANILLNSVTENSRKKLMNNITEIVNEIINRTIENLPILSGRIVIILDDLEKRGDIEIYDNFPFVDAIFKISDNIRYAINDYLMKTEKIIRYFSPSIFQQSVLSNLPPLLEDLELPPLPEDYI